ncbi:hypothetical protein D0859_08307 [Hortaea werneckii]|uniref:FCP1 homology domain-containing protein n=1 Tax=Hortaea werneckii TaxID=91943 RepID=A0A3M7IQH9_HORWE|nr:hypothetical protein D0859_08307 [Hortaea werneckii]
MNSLNIVSRLTTTPPPSPPRSRTSSSANIETVKQSIEGQEDGLALDAGSLNEKLERHAQGDEDGQDRGEGALDEKTALLEGNAQEQDKSRASRIWSLPQRVANAVLYGATVVFSTITAPGRFVIACFYDHEGHFSAVLPLKNFRNLVSRRRRKSLPQSSSAVNATAQAQDEAGEKQSPQQRRKSSRRSPSVDSTASTISASSIASDAESELGKHEDSPARHTRSKTGSLSPSPQSEEIAPHKKAGRVKLLHNDDAALRKRRSSRAAALRKSAAGNANPEDVESVANALKSPSSPTSNANKTRYPRAPAPPRPLVPRRHPSYTLSYSAEAPKKTLIIDLDETLIHSMAKGGRMSTGHMVEVRLGSPAAAPGAALGPGFPILYYVHERPGCHDFLRKVSKWYNLIAFTASVQEYADPVIDWLERERKYFSGRYYRQHCTLRNGAYIKDLSFVEPDLSRVMILDNSPMSYIFHEGSWKVGDRSKHTDFIFSDNAIPIEGWISDPTDNDLLHLIPLLEGLQYVTDVRALLALRQGLAQQA